MFEILLSLINENPKVAKGSIIQEELRNLEQKSNGRFEAGKGAHDDVILSFCFTLFARHEMIAKGTIKSPDDKNKFISHKAINTFIDATFSTLKDSARIIQSADKKQLIDETDESYYKKEEKRLKKEFKTLGFETEKSEDFYETLIF